MDAVVVAVAQSPVHGFSKPVTLEIRLLAGLGVEGDAHAGDRVKHRSRVARDPTQPNLRQVHCCMRNCWRNLPAAASRCVRAMSGRTC